MVTYTILLHSVHWLTGLHRLHPAEVEDGDDSDSQPGICPRKPHPY